MKVLKPNNYKQLIISLFLMISISACQSDLPVDLPNMQGNEVMPATGYAETTEFTYSTKVATEDYDVVLLLWSPNIDNEWDWLPIPMIKGDGNSYSISKGLAEHSSDYKYKYGLQDKETEEILLSTAEMLGPNLIVNNSDQQAPSILRTNPVNGSVGVDPSQEVHFIFDEVIDPASVSTNNITLSDSSNLISSVAAYQNRVTVTFSDTFDQSFDFSQEASQYSLTIQGVSDLNGNVMTAPYAFDFHINSPLLQNFEIKSEKLSSLCLGVVDVKKRFAAPESWNPVVKLTACEAANEDLSQRWLFSTTPGLAGTTQIRWAYNYEYCLVKNSGLSDPVIRRCDNSTAQTFSLPSYATSNYQIVSQAGGCIAVGTRSGEGVLPSLCDGIMYKSRNHWYITAKAQQELSQPFLLGNVDVRFANIKYENAEKGVNLSTAETRELVQYLYQTNALNQQQIYNELLLEGSVNKGEGFETANPYFPRYKGNDIPLPKPRAIMVNGTEVFNPEQYDDTKEGYKFTDTGVEYFQQEVVSRWHSDITNSNAAANEVCAIQFTDSNQVDYNMRTFSSKFEAQAAGWTITHQYQCGTCSTLKDLAVYMGVKDQTTPIRLCTKRGKAKNSNLDQVKQCIADSVGFTPMCAESWAYNGLHTGQECKSTCMKAYGNDALFWPRAKAFFTMVIAEKFNACPAEVETSDPVLRQQMKASGCPLANENTGKLNACLWCDEKTSGPGFKYTAARTRRGSGLESAIPRPNDPLFYDADHTLYFQ